MKNLATRCTTLVALCALLALAAGPASAATKLEMYDEMIALAGQMQAIKSIPAQAGEYAALSARYETLSAQLGGDRPGLPQEAVGGGTHDGGGSGLPPSCTGQSQSFPSTDTPLPIPDGPGGTVNSVLAVAGAGVYLLDVDLVTNIPHTFAGDLDITLTSPAGTIVTVTTDNGGANDNVFAGTNWDDGGGSVNPPGPVTDNVFANLVVETPLVAEEALGAFLGEDPNGNWTLTVVDDAGIDVGTLTSWSLVITSLDTATIDVTSNIVSTDTPLPIPDGPGGSVTSTIAVAGLDSFLCKVAFDTTIPHTFAGDLDITLTSPAGTAVTVTTDNGGANDNVFAGTTWDDAGGATNPPGPVTDNVFANLVVETPLVVEEANGAFLGEDPNGNWALNVVDDAGIDVGTLTSWDLTFTTCSCVLPEADLSILKTGVVNPDNTAVYTITVTNNGPADATGVVVTDTLPACTVYVSDDCGGADVPPFTWNIGALANGGIAVCNVTVDGSGCVGAVVNTATVSSDQTDPVSTNDSSTATLIFEPPFEIPTLNEVGLGILLLALAGAAIVMLRRRTA